MRYCDGNHFGQEEYRSEGPSTIDVIRARLAKRTPLERVMDEMDGIRWSPESAAKLKAAIDAATIQPAGKG